MKPVQEQAHNQQQNQSQASHPTHISSRTGEHISDHHDQTGSTDTMRNLETSNIYPMTAPTAESQYQATTKDLLLFVVCWRRNVRRAVAFLDTQRATSRGYRRQARILRERASPFDNARIAVLEAAATQVKTACESMRESLKECGRLLADAAPMIDAGTTLARRCEILNVNQADRGVLTDTDGLIKIIYLHRLEDSAASIKDEWNSGPLFQASQEVFIDFLLNHEEGRKLGDSLFERGGMFANVPTFKQAADGTMQRQPPRLHVVPDVLSEPATGAVL